MGIICISHRLDEIRQIADRVVGSGIGQRITIGLAQCGADVALLDRRTDDALAKAAEAIAEAGWRAVKIQADVTSGASLEAAVAETEAKLGALSLAVNAAGIANANPAEDMAETQFQTMMDINIKGVFVVPGRSPHDGAPRPRRDRQHPVDLRCDR